nr:PREDICTED: uncharacterized protein LOC109627559 isoform X2 [Paralichthys olivaceus]
MKGSALRSNSRYTSSQSRRATANRQSRIRRMWNDTVRRQTESSFIAADVNNTPTLNRAALGNHFLTNPVLQTHAGASPYDTMLAQGYNQPFTSTEGGVSQSQESCGLDSVCLNGGYTPNTFTLHGLGTTPGSRAGVVGSTDLLREGGVGIGGEDISPALLTPHGATDLGSAGMRRNLSDAAALEKMIISELVQSNLRPSVPMPVPPERYGSLARPHHHDRAALMHTATLTRHPQPAQDGWAATMQPNTHHNAQDGWSHTRHHTQDVETHATTRGQDHATTPRLQDGWSHAYTSGDTESRELLKDGDRSQLQGTLGRRGLQDRQQARPPDVQARPYSTLSRTPGTLSRHRGTVESSVGTERERERERDWDRYRDRPLPPPPPPPPQESEPLYKALEEPLLSKQREAGVEAWRGGQNREKEETFHLKRDGLIEEWRGGAERGRDDSFTSQKRDGEIDEWRGGMERGRDEPHLLEKRDGRLEVWRGGAEAEKEETFITQKKDFGIEVWRGGMEREKEETLFLKDRDGWRAGVERENEKQKDRALDVWRGGMDVDREESFLFESKDGGLDGRKRGKDRGSLRYHGEREDSESFALPLTPDLDLDPDSSPIYARDSNPSPLYPGERSSPPLSIFPRSSPPTNIFAPRDTNSPPNNLYSRHSPQVYSRSSSPPRFYTRTSPPTLSYPDSSPEGPEEVSPAGQRPALELPYSLGRPPLGPRPNHLQTFYQPPPLATNGDAAYTAEPTSEGDDGQMQRVTSL